MTATSSDALSDTLLDTWSATVKATQLSRIIPDGCRDLILTRLNNYSFSAHISPLFNQTKTIESFAGTSLQGFRLKPGTIINEQALIVSLDKHALDTPQIIDRIDEFTYRDSNVIEAIDCLSSGISSVEQAAKQLGMSQRTLQRLMLKQTARSPHYWLRLARVRRAARELIAKPYSELLGDEVYADQSHCCREIKHWFGLSISVLKQSQDFCQQISDKAYA